MQMNGGMWWGGIKDTISNHDKHEVTTPQRSHSKQKNELNIMYHKSKHKNPLKWMLHTSTKARYTGLRCKLLPDLKCSVKCSRFFIFFWCRQLWRRLQKWQLQPEDFGWLCLTSWMWALSPQRSVREPAGELSAVPYGLGGKLTVRRGGGFWHHPVQTSQTQTEAV